MFKFTANDQRNGAMRTFCPAGRYSHWSIAVVGRGSSFISKVSDFYKELPFRVGKIYLFPLEGFSVFKEKQRFS